MEVKFPPSQGKFSLTALSRMKANWDGKAELAELDMTPTIHATWELHTFIPGWG